LDDDDLSPSFCPLLSMNEETRDLLALLHEVAKDQSRRGMFIYSYLSCCYNLFKVVYLTRARTICSNDIGSMFLKLIV
jgi:hypothetical protein